MTVFSKPALTLQEHINLLRERGLEFDTDPESGAIRQLEHFLTYIGYYRLSGYMRSFQTGSSHHFHSQVTFNDVVMLYNFDRHLRNLMLDALERIEIAFRAIINDVMVLKYGSHWYEVSEHFAKHCNHNTLLAAIRRDMGYPKTEEGKASYRTEAIKHYKATYLQPGDPPSWIMIQSLTFGTMSKLYKLLAAKDQKAVSKHVCLDHGVLQSWLHGMTDIRNACAHHERVWNRTIRPLTKYPHTLAPTLKELPNNHMGIYISVVNHILCCVSPDTDWYQNIVSLITDNRTVIDKAGGLTAMGMPSSVGLGLTWCRIHF
jgi:abortive infection bacteriophage resistance protein